MDFSINSANCRW